MPQPSYEELWADNQRLQAENLSLRRQLEQLQRTVAQLSAQLEAAIQAAKRQAAPLLTPLARQPERDTILRGRRR